MKQEIFEPKILAFCCHYCAYSSADLAGSMRIQYPPNVRIIRTPCTGRLETEYFMKAFENGADGVLVAGCLEGGCHFVEGNLCAKRRVNYTREMLEEIGMEKERLRMVNVSAAMARPLADTYYRYGGNCSQTGPKPDKTKWFIKTGEPQMIVAQRKNIPDMLEIVKNHKKILVLGCGTCVTVCLAGGQREVSIIASALRMAAKLKGLPLEVEELTIERQCDNVFIEQAAEAIERNDAVLSLGCGAGVQAIAERYSDKPVYAGLDTAFIGILEERGVWTEKCAACGACVLHRIRRHLPGYSLCQTHAQRPVQRLHAKTAAKSVPNVSAPGSLYTSG